MQECKKIVLQCHSEPTFRYKIISQNQCDTACKIFSSSFIVVTELFKLSVKLTDWKMQPVTHIFRFFVSLNQHGFCFQEKKSIQQLLTSNRGNTIAPSLMQQEVLTYQQKYFLQSNEILIYTLSIAFQQARITFEALY